MCGIVGCIGDLDVPERLLTGLEHLEYRGYDSAGVAIRTTGGLFVRKTAGEVGDLRSEWTSFPQGAAGIGHTRWSTHGPPTDANAHPHTSCGGDVAVVHNGVVENYEYLRDRLSGEGHEFGSDTDTEVVPHLIESYRSEGYDNRAAIRRAVDDLEGSYALGILVDGDPALYAARNDSPLVIGVADDARFLGSDVPAFLERTERAVYLHDGDVAELFPGDHRIVDADGRRVERPVKTVEWVHEETRKGRHDHYMKKEIDEQPSAVESTIEGRIDGSLSMEGFPEYLPDVSEVHFVACGTSYHAALYGRQLLLERGVPASVSLASEYAATPLPVREDTLVVGVTQSGETADTLRALRTAQEKGARTLALTNVRDSTADRECDDAMYIRAGPEIGVAATKTFSSQVATLLLFVEAVAGEDEDTTDRLTALSALPEQLGEVLGGNEAATVGRRYADSEGFFFIGRGVDHPVAMEGALKLKEISYEHAEGFPAGELKHGPLALVTPNTPVIAVLSGRQDHETLTNVEEVAARGAPVIAVTNRDDLSETVDDVLPFPESHPHVAPVLANVQLQLFAYHTADELGRPIDKPRNLAKSVTVK
jgi:glucosamine--fructose-6-phosphate aminotransferase (isomerizing)